MSLSMLSKAMDATGLTPEQKLIFIFIGDATTEDGRVHVTDEYLAEKTGLHEEAVMYVVDELIDLGWLSPRKVLNPVGDRITVEKTARAAWQAIRNRIAPTILERDGNRCKHCGATDRLGIDHVIPLARGGGNEDENLQVLCGSCNSRKGAR